MCAASCSAAAAAAAATEGAVVECVNGVPVPTEYKPIHLFVGATAMPGREFDVPGAWHAPQGLDRTVACAFEGKRAGFFADLSSLAPGPSFPQITGIGFHGHAARES